MTSSIIITLCSLLLLAYFFDISSSKTRVPSVILLLILGWLSRQAVILFNIHTPSLEAVLPVLGTLGLILIVLEGSLELEINRSRLGFISKAASLALLPLLAMSFVLAAAISHFGEIDFKTALANAIPFAVISSAIAIPCARALRKETREFVTYESSLSDIFGVIIFNFITLNDNIKGDSFGEFMIQMIIMLAISLIATLLLALLLSRIKHHVKFTPIILMIFLIYAIAKVFHLPALIFILIFGTFISNLDEIKQYKFTERFRPQILKQEIIRFKEITSEVAFVARALFLILFGFLINTHELMNTQTVLWSIGITAGIFLLRAIFLLIFRIPIAPLLFIAPRGLITILLFLSLPAAMVIPLVGRSLIIQVIILSAFIMMLGLLSSGNEKTSDNPAELPEGRDVEGANKN